MAVILSLVNAETATGCVRCYQLGKVTYITTHSIIEVEWRICAVPNWAIIGSDDGLRTGWYPAITWTNTGNHQFDSREWPVKFWSKLIYSIQEEYAFQHVVCKMAAILSRSKWLNTLRPRQNRRHFADNIFKCILLNENVWIALRISLKFVPKVRIINMPSLVQIMAWCRPGDKPLSEPVVISLPTHICVTRPQWVNQTGAMYL